jgi:hypothetical protein
VVVDVEWLRRPRAAREFIGRQFQGVVPTAV